MKVTFNLPEGADSKAVEETIEKLIKAYDVTDLGIAKGKIRKISSEVNTVMNENKGVRHCVGRIRLVDMKMTL